VLYVSYLLYLFFHISDSLKPNSSKGLNNVKELCDFNSPRLTMSSKEYLNNSNVQKIEHESPKRIKQYYKYDNYLKSPSRSRSRSRSPKKYSGSNGLYALYDIYSKRTYNIDNHNIIGHESLGGLKNSKGFSQSRVSRSRNKSIMSNYSISRSSSNSSFHHSRPKLNNSSILKGKVWKGKKRNVSEFSDDSFYGTNLKDSYEKMQRSTSFDDLQKAKILNCSL